MRVYLDANFFISGFSDRPKDVFVIKEAAEMVGWELWITRQVFHELRWYLRREVEEMIQIEETLSKEIKSFMESFHRPESSLPQSNDMSLVLAAMRAKEAKIVTSDLKLLNTIEDLDVDTEGMVGSAFVLQLMEMIDDEALKKKLGKIRDRIYTEEVRYSISRQGSYDPVARIRVIEEHAMSVLRDVKRPAEVDKKLSKGQPLFVLDFLEDIKAGIPDMFEDFKAGKYDTLAREIETVQNEIERMLIASTLTQDKETHDALVNHASDLTLFLYFLEMICHLYRGTRDGLEYALKISEEAFRLLMFAGITNDELKASVFFVRIVLYIVREDYNEIDYYYSLYDSMLERAGLKEMNRTSEGLYVTMQILREFMGGFSLRKTKLANPEVTIAMLIDISKYAIQFDNHENAWQLAVNAYKIGVAYNKEEGALTSFLMLYKISSSAHDKFENALEKIAEHALKVFVKKGWNTASVTPILNELQGSLVSVEEVSFDETLGIEDIPDELQGWMDVLMLTETKGKEYLIVRNEKIHARIGIDVSKHPDLKILMTGHKVALTHGEFTLTKPPKVLTDKHAVVLVITPSEGSEVSFEGEYGFSYLKVAEPKKESE
ncbi:MAG: hypothetical protein BAJATHORv1_60122 [Candidatus Thorarchaeota archaeon]|nr:MAG: hypothetical protein BAJATHORv1_60122 [Candidatus Thorarchaeota archaeon]